MVKPGSATVTPGPSRRKPLSWTATLLLVTCLCGCVPDSPWKGEACLGIGDYENAIVFFQRSIDAHPVSFRSRRGLALSLLQKCSAREADGAVTAEEWTTAVLAAHYAQRIREDSTLRSRQAVAAFKAAKCFEARGDTANALRYALQAVALQPRDLSAINYAAVLSYRTGNAGAARDLFLQAVAVDSSDAVAFFDIGMLHWYSRDVLRAYDWWLRALKRSPSDTEIVYWVARAESEMKKMAGKK